VQIDIMETKIQNSLSDLSHTEILQLDRDYMEAAKMAKLRYVTDSITGIIRQKRGKGFVYIYKNVVVKDEEMLDRIRKLVIPPAWKNVWICPFANGHIQATGIDARGRKQYKYHAQWSALRNETKFHRLYEFGKALPSLRMQVEKDLSRRELDQQRVLATIVSLMERTYIRIGNEDYNKLYGSHGMTTLKDSHVEVKGTEVKFCFTGKRGIRHTISLKSRRLARIVQQCKDIPGKELFQYLDEDGNRQPIDSGMVNDYIKETSGGEFTAKDFRTWAGTLNLLRSLRSVGEAITETECKRNIVKALDEVSMKLGNTRTVCRKYYVHPGLIDLYEKNNLSRYLKELDEIEEPDMKTDLTSDEKILMRILRTLH
jgi:DNA topoisomerase I